MGHAGNIKGAYWDLRKRLDKYPVGAPDRAYFYEILKAIFTEEEAQISAKMPLRFRDLETLSKDFGMEKDKLRVIFEKMALKGAILDFEHDGVMYYMLSPTLPGIMEMSLMRERDDLPQQRLSELYDEATDDGEMARSIVDGQTQFFRVLVNEPSLDPDVESEVLTHEKASDMIRGSENIAIGLCYCRHEREHCGHRCKYPMDTCTSMNLAGEFVIRRGHGRRATASEALELLAKTSELGMVHLGDNVRKKPTFVCHCCDCCCTVLRSINRFELFNNLNTSNFMAKTGRETCVGCGKCARKCPINAIMLVSDGFPKKLHAVVDEAICLGCGVCAGVCAKDSIKMVSKKARQITPETTFERLITMSLERGKLSHALIDNQVRLDHRVMNRILATLLKLPPLKQALAQKQVKSLFISAIVETAKRTKFSWVLEL